MNKILLIGNSGMQKKETNGQTIKVCLYLKKIKDEGFDVSFVDLEKFSKQPISTILAIKKGMLNADRIVLMTAERGIKILLPFINKVNKRAKKPLVFPLIGISALHYSIDGLIDDEKNDFFINHNYSKIKAPRWLLRQLSQITYILPETELLCEAFSNFYQLNNVYQLNNFRDHIPSNAFRNENECLRIVFLSRVMDIKGIFELIECVYEINKAGHTLHLDVFGELHFSKDEMIRFNSMLNGNAICYKGTVSNEKTISIFNNYDIFVFPTKYYGEGTPGVIVESLLAGTPILTSSFPQVTNLLKDGYDSLFFKMCDKEDLKDKLLYIIKNKHILPILRKGALESGQKYTYEHEKKKFLKYVCGIEEG